MIHVNVPKRKLIMPWEATLGNIFPSAPVLTLKGNKYVAIDHGIDQVRFLRNIGYQAPAPILHQYDWAGGTPFEIQKLTAALLTTNYRAYVLNSFGTGKTKSALWAWHFLYTNGLAGKMLVIAPLSTLTFTWSVEVFKTLPNIKVQILHGSRERRLKRLADPEASIFVINHDGLETVVGELAKRPDIDTLCIDELAAYRNNSDRTKVVKKYAQPLKWVWGMTGSPTPNAPTDAWAQATVVTPQTVPKYFTHFRDQVMNRVTQFKYVPKHDAIQQVHRVLQPAVRFTLSDVIELPDVVEREQEVKMGTEQARVYNEMAKFARAKVSSGDIDAMNAYYAQNNAAAAAGQENLVKAEGLLQPGRDRAALQTKENYGAKIQPTLTAAALSGAGYNQALGDIFMNSVERDRTLAGLNDQGKIDKFQLLTSQQNLEAQREQQAQAAYNEMLNKLQENWDSRVKTTLDWVV